MALEIFLSYFFSKIFLLKGLALKVGMGVRLSLGTLKSSLNFVRWWVWREGDTGFVRSLLELSHSGI
jgi:hypothetical protein